MYAAMLSTFSLLLCLACTVKCQMETPYGWLDQWRKHHTFTGQLKDRPVKNVPMSVNPIGWMDPWRQRIQQWADPERQGGPENFPFRSSNAMNHMEGKHSDSISINIDSNRPIWKSRPEGKVDFWKFHSEGFKPHHSYGPHFRPEHHGMRHHGKPSPFKIMMELMHLCRDLAHLHHRNKTDIDANDDVDMMNFEGEFQWPEFGRPTLRNDLFNNFAGDQSFGRGENQDASIPDVENPLGTASFDRGDSTRPSFPRDRKWQPRPGPFQRADGIGPRFTRNDQKYDARLRMSVDGEQPPRVSAMEGGNEWLERKRLLIGMFLGAESDERPTPDQLKKIFKAQIAVCKQLRPGRRTTAVPPPATTPSPILT